MIIVTQHYFTSLEKNPSTARDLSPDVARTRFHVKTQQVLGAQRREFEAIKTREIRSNVSVNTC